MELLSILKARKSKKKEFLHINLLKIEDSESNREILRSTSNEDLRTPLSDEDTSLLE